MGAETNDEILHRQERDRWHKKPPEPLKHQNRFCIGKNRIDCVKKLPEPLKHLNKLYIGKNMIDSIKFNMITQTFQHSNRVPFLLMTNLVQLFDIL